MLRGVSSTEFHSVLAWAPLFKEQLLRQRSLAFVLWLVEQSQRTSSRLLWYQTCFFFASLSKISERGFHQLFYKRWSFSFFFFFSTQSFFFRTLEYYFNGVDHLKFSAKYFRGTSVKITQTLLPYKHFHLRAPSSLFFVLWYHAEQVRMRFFNDYVKSHDFINHSSHLARRFRFQKTIFSYRVRGCRKMLLRYFFFFYSKADRYRVLEFKGKMLTNELTSFSFSPVMLPSLYQSSSLQLALGTKKFPMEPLAAIRQRFLIGINFLQMNLWSNTLLSQDPLSFGHMVRMDWTHFLASFPIFVLSFRLRPWLHIWTSRLIKKFCTLILKEYRRAPFDFFLLQSLRQSLLPLSSSYRLYFSWWVLEFRINRFWNGWVLDKWARVSVFYNTRTAAKMFPLNYQILNYIRLYRAFLFKFTVFGDLKNISPFFTKTMLPLDFLFWRMSSNGQMYRDFFLTGAYTLSTVYRKLTLDHYALQRSITFRVSLETILLRFGFFICAGFTWQGLQNNPWCLTPPYKRLPDGVYHPNEPRWSFTNHILILAVRRFVLSIFRRSWILSLFSFFIVYHQTVSNPFRFLFFFNEIVSTFVAYQRSYFFYKNTHLKQFRRYPHKVFVHSRVDPSFRARWFSFADRMRRAGIKRSDLPYYPESDDTDVVADLTTRNSKFFWSRAPRYWIVNPLI